MSETTRPKWASGPEWEGWEVWGNDIVGRSLRESDGPLLIVHINSKGWLGIGVDEECREIATKSPAHALNAANALAEAAGGWE